MHRKQHTKPFLSFHHHSASWVDSQANANNNNSNGIKKSSLRVMWLSSSRHSTLFFQFQFQFHMHIRTLYFVLAHTHTRHRRRRQQERRKKHYKLQLSQWPVCHASKKVSTKMHWKRKMRKINNSNGCDSFWQTIRNVLQESCCMTIVMDNFRLIGCSFYCLFCSAPFASVSVWRAILCETVEEWDCSAIANCKQNRTKAAPTKKHDDERRQQQKNHKKNVAFITKCNLLV